MQYSISCQVLQATEFQSKKERILKKLSQHSQFPDMTKTKN